MQVGTFLGLAKTVLAFDLDVVEAVREGEALDLRALGFGRTVGHQRQLDATRSQRIDGVVRAWKYEHLFLAKGREAVGNPYREFPRKCRPGGIGKGGKAALDHLSPGLSEFQPPLRFRNSPELPCKIENRGSDQLRRMRGEFAGKFRRDGVPCQFGPAVGRQDGIIHVDQHRAGQFAHYFKAISLRGASRTGSNRHCHRSSARRWCHGRRAN